jgi:NADH-quinone oxidoreductase subunit J
MATFFNAAALFILLGAEFLGFMLIIVYVGAVAVLFLFVVMMIPLPKHTFQQQAKNHLPFILSIVSMMGGELFFFLKHWPLLQEKILGKDTFLFPAKALGEVLYTEYFLAFQLGGILLLIAIIGAIVLTLTPSTFSKKQRIYEQIARQPHEVLEIHKVPSHKGKEQ